MSLRIPILCKFTVVALLAVTSVGCGSLRIPVFQAPSGSQTYMPIGSGITLAGTESRQVYEKLRQAKRENAIVLEVVGDDEPIRVLPLPPEQTSVFVSQLLQQTGVQDKLGSVEATLFRATSDTVSGIPMEVRMDELGESVRPESDYALRPGDRLRVSEKEFNPIESLGGLIGI